MGGRMRGQRQQRQQPQWQEQEQDMDYGNGGFEEPQYEEQQYVEEVGLKASTQQQCTRLSMSKPPCLRHPVSAAAPQHCQHW
jgi:hypothetical protein